MACSARSRPRRRSQSSSSTPTRCTNEPFTFCAGLDIWYHSEEDVNLLANQRGPGLVYYGVSARGTSTWTNLDTGGTYTNVWTARDKDLTIAYDEATDTLTIVVLATGSSRWYDADGNFVLADPGQVRYKILIDAKTGHLRTPSTMSSSGTSAS